MIEEFKSGFQFEMKAEGDAMTVEAYASTFGGAPDAYGDVIEKGAYVASLEKLMPKMCYQHNLKLLPGRWTDAAEDNHGLYLKGFFINTPLGHQVREEAKSGAIDSVSIGYKTVESIYDPKTGIRKLKKIDLFEVSFVTFPANPAALIASVKEAPTTIRAFEEFLRDAGYSREQAKSIAARGFKAAEDQRDAGDDLAALSKSLTDLTRKLKDVYVQ